MKKLLIFVLLIFISSFCLGVEDEKVMEENLMKPKIVERDAFIIAGLKYFGNNANDEIGQLWGKFSQQMDSIENRINKKHVYGYDTWDDKIKETGEFTYIAAVEVSEENNIPEGMEYVKIPANKYAVFSFKMKKMSDSFVQEIYSKWFPESGLKMSDNYDFEFYDENFDPEDENSIVHFYIPVQ